MSSSRRRRGASLSNNSGDDDAAYKEIMGHRGDDAAAHLSGRLATFRTWLEKDAAVVVHPAVCVVNGEATDGTRNAPVLEVETSATAPTQMTVSERVGIVDEKDDQALYDRTMGCQLRAVREIKKGEVLMAVPRKAMITPDVVAASDAGRAVLACCRTPPGTGGTDNGKIDFWDVFENTTIRIQKFLPKVPRNSGAQALVKIVQERKKVQAAFQKYSAEADVTGRYTLAEPKTISTRAPLLAFLIHQRFSNVSRPAVASEGASRDIPTAVDGNALTRAKEYSSLAPETFAPYARTLPSSVSVPLCWERSELVLLMGCLPGHGLLQHVGLETLHLAAEFMALLNAGILSRFPRVFPRGVLTWERWVWAAAVVSSRILPASCYFDDGVKDPASWKPENPLEFQSPAEVWGELGVMIPLLDMLNHEIEAYHVTWKPSVTIEGGSSYDTEKVPPRAISHKKIRKGCEIFMNYGIECNNDMIERYGFALMGNPADKVKFGGGLADAVGNVKPPHDFAPTFEVSRDLVFESNDEKAISAWWTDDRMNLLKREALAGLDDSFVRSLPAGRKLTFEASGDGTYDPIFLTYAMIATMPSESVSKNLKRAEGSSLVLSGRHLLILHRYLEFFFVRKTEKLLQNLSRGLKDLFIGVSLWTKFSEGGIDYEQEPDSADAASLKSYIGWQSFFDSHAYKTAMEVEKHYYAMGSDSCVLTLCDCQLRVLQACIQNLATNGKLSNNILNQLADLDISTVEAKVDAEDQQSSKDAKQEVAETGSNGRDSSGSRSSRGRKRNKNKNKSPGSTRPPALKLHVGNLSYKTTPSDLYDYFCGLYGQENVLECHIPTERESGRSRGFGFVAMPEEVAHRVLQSGRKHEVGGRVVKIAKSNSVGSGNSGRVPEAPPPPPSDRCASCGYRPKYCSCHSPRVPSYQDPLSGPYGPSRERSRDRDSSRHYDRYERYGRYDDYDRDRHSHRHRGSSSKSYERTDDRRMRRERERSRDRGRSPGRYWDEGRSSRYDRRSDGSWERDRKRSRSRSRSRERSRKKKSKRRNRSRSRSPSPP